VDIVDAVNTVDRDEIVDTENTANRIEWMQ
jgi:hypothetical protein